jgi:murein DD-endopeptidase MepM/ murein hydrolase activator NlpD
MQSDGKSFTFRFSHSSRSKIYIRRIEISRRFLQNGLLTIVLFFGVSLFSFAILGVFNSGIRPDQDIATSLRIPSVNPLSTSVHAQANSIDYSRPLPSSGYVMNSGGPADTRAADGDAMAVETQLRLLQTTGDPAFLPSIWAHAGKINNEFGFRRSPFGGRNYEFHAGMDIDGERGDFVVAPAGGVVTKASWQGGYGNMVEVDHGNGLISRFGHLSKIEVEVGAPLQRGQLMGFVGSTGRSTGPHLHYELRFNDKPINPRRFLPPEPKELKKIIG